MINSILLVLLEHMHTHLLASWILAISTQCKSHNNLKLSKLDLDIPLFITSEVL